MGMLCDEEVRENGFVSREESAREADGLRGTEVSALEVFRRRSSILSEPQWEYKSCNCQ